MEDSQWLQDGIKRQTTSEYASTVVVVKRKDGTPRLCMNFKRLNENTMRDRYRLPIVEDQIDRLNGYNVFSRWLFFT